MSKKVYILILNFNGWQDTIECLESVVKSDYDNVQIIVVDNNSPNGSLQYIVDWADGNQAIIYPDYSQLKSLSQPEISKPVDYVVYDKKIAVVGGEPTLEATKQNPLILIQSGENNGFSAGNNIGIQYALAKDDAEFIWLLNNDTVIETATLTELVKASKNKGEQGEKTGIIGSKLAYYNSPDLIQAVMGTHNKWLATSKQIGQFERDDGQFDADLKLTESNYPMGASMFVSTAFIRDVGLMCEDYFLYFEEIDWTLRGQKRGWGIAYCGQAKVYHKEGATIGSNGNPKAKSKLADYYALKNRMVFTKKFYPKQLWSVRLSFLGVIFKRIVRGQFDRLGLVFNAFFSST